MTAAVVVAGLSADEWAAARLAAGEDVPDATPAARDLAAAALEGADRQVMDDLTDAGDAAYRPSGSTGPRVSDYGGCGRAVWYRDSPPVGYEPAPVDNRRATLGNVIHAAAEAARSARYPWRRYEMKLPIPGLDKIGRVDEYDPVLGEVTDDKTAGDRKWEVYSDGPPDSAWGQVLIYGLALEELGMPVRTVRIIAINRDSGAEEHFRREYDPAAARSALDELIALATLLDLGEVPVREGTGPGSFPCSWCEARLHCWNVAAAEVAGRSPESYTILGAEPDDPTIEWAAANLHAATRANTSADKAKKDAERLLVGIKPGTYGGMEVNARSRRMPNYKAAFLRLLALWPLPDSMRPPVERVENPPVRVDRWIEAKPVRAAKKAAAKKAAGGATRGRKKKAEVDAPAA